MNQQLQGNPNLRDSLSIAEQLGCVVRPVHRTGETYVSHPMWSKPLILNGRRKDTCRALLKNLRQLLRRAHAAS